MPAANHIQVVDDTLKKLADQGLDDVPMLPKPDVTVGPLDRDADGPRLNWFLYRVVPNPAYRNMEYPPTGSRVSRGAPPLALQLHYLLTAFPAQLTATGDQQQTAHIALTAAMRRLHDNPIVGTGSPFLPLGAPPLVEPIRIALETLDLETLSKLWTAASKPIRISVGYVVTIVLVDAMRTHTQGPPVRTVRQLVVPSLGPRLRSLTPGRVGADMTTVAAVEGLVPHTRFLLAPDPGDPAPAPADGWPLDVAGTDPTGVVLKLPRHDLAPGLRRLDALAAVEGLPLHGDSIALTVVPTVRSAAAPVVSGAPVTLTTSHTTPDVELFFEGKPIAVTSATATQVTFTVPAGSSGRRTVLLRADRVAGPPFDLEVTA